MQTTATRPDARPSKAALLATTAGQWIKTTTKNGVRFYGVPSATQPGHYHLANLHACSCPDFQRRQQPCKHVQAVRLYVEAVRSEQACRANVVDITDERAKRAALVARYESIYGEGAA